MKFSRYLLPTLKEDPSDAHVMSHKLMVRAGLIRKETAGTYAYLPLGLKVLKNIINVVKEEMDKAGALECLMPEITSAEFWKESDRWDKMGQTMFQIKDRNNLEYALGPTHEEAFTNIVRSTIKSYKDLPVNLYQINTKFRDEIRPRFGVIRSKEFIMKDAYSFDIDQDGLDESYDKMAEAYRNIFSRCGIETISVHADTGDMGGSASEEFMVPLEVGEETLLLCDSCSYQANQERAEFKRSNETSNDENLKIEKVSTPNIKTIDQLTEFFNCSKNKFLKSIIYIADDKPVMVVVTGEREINEVKLKNYLKCSSLDLADDETVFKVTEAPVGFAGPITDEEIRIIYDIDVKNIKNAITGANKKDFHFKNVNNGIDFTIQEEADIVCAEKDDLCPECGKPMYVKKGLEVGHIFKLGYKYTKAMNVTVLDQNGKAVNPIMGCYGIGVTRTLAAVIEQHNDENGLIWPKSITPFEVHLVGIGKKEEEKEQIDEVYTLLNKDFDVLYDDRKLSPGIKFSNADLIGLPIRITVGRNYFTESKIEIKIRRTGESFESTKENLINDIQNHLNAI